jgi:lysyl-tRNA synthetase class 2
VDLPTGWADARVSLSTAVSDGAYFVDFVCLKARLVIEVDGEQHAEQSGYDDRRTAWLEDGGVRVLRFWNDEVLRETEGVWETIALALSPTALEQE